MPNPIVLTEEEKGALKLDLGLMTTDRDYHKRMFGIADQCAHEREAALFAKDREIRALVAERDVLREALFSIKAHAGNHSIIRESASAALAHSAQEVSDAD